MRLEKLSLYQFRNYQSAEIRPQRQFVVLTGENGAGKTNILEALYYLSFCRTVRSGADSQNLLHGADGFRVAGECSRDGKKFAVEIRFRSREGKRLFFDGEQEKKLAQHIGRLPLVFIGPEDQLLINGYSEDRRRFLDVHICQTNAEYLRHLMRYNRLLKQRNALLKQSKVSGAMDRALLESYTGPMAEAASLIYKVRTEFIEAFTPEFEQTYARLSVGKEVPSLKYKSALEGESLEVLFAKSARSDEVLGRTTEGIHKDDLILDLDGHPVRKAGSQGQKKTYLMSLKLAMWKWLEARVGCSPLLLLDDIFDKLDRHRIQALFTLLKEAEFGQVFISDTNPVRVHEVFTDVHIPFQHVEINDGIVHNSNLVGE